MLREIILTLILIFILFLLSFYDLSKTILYDFNFDKVFYIENFIILLIYMILIYIENHFRFIKIFDRKPENFIYSRLIYKIVLLTISFYFIIYFSQILLLISTQNLTVLQHKSIYNFNFFIELLLSIFLYPFFEELFFRKSILQNLTKKYSTKKSIIITSLLFSFAHIFNDQAGLIPIFLAGLLLGYVYVRFGFIASFISHSISNLIGFIIIPSMNKILSDINYNIYIILSLFFVSILLFAVYLNKLKVIKQ